MRCVCVCVRCVCVFASTHFWMLDLKHLDLSNLQFRIFWKTTLHLNFFLWISTVKALHHLECIFLFLLLFITSSSLIFCLQIKNLQTASAPSDMAWLRYPRPWPSYTCHEVFSALLYSNSMVVPMTDLYEAIARENGRKSLDG